MKGTEVQPPVLRLILVFVSQPEGGREGGGTLSEELSSEETQAGRDTGERRRRSVEIERGREKGGKVKKRERESERERERERVEVTSPVLVLGGNLRLEPAVAILMHQG